MSAMALDLLLVQRWHHRKLPMLLLDSWLIILRTSRLFVFTRKVLLFCFLLALQFYNIKCLFIIFLNDEIVLGESVSWFSVFLWVYLNRILLVLKSSCAAWIPVVWVSLHQYSFLRNSLSGWRLFGANRFHLNVKLVFLGPFSSNRTVILLTQLHSLVSFHSLGWRGVSVINRLTVDVLLGQGKCFFAIRIFVIVLVPFCLFFLKHLWDSLRVFSIIILYLTILFDDSNWLRNTCVSRNWHLTSTNYNNFLLFFKLQIILNQFYLFLNPAFFRPEGHIFIQLLFALWWLSLELL